jgi:hypothetical protein
MELPITERRQDSAEPFWQVASALRPPEGAQVMPVRTVRQRDHHAAVLHSLRVMTDYRVDDVTQRALRGVAAVAMAIALAGCGPLGGDAESTGRAPAAEQNTDTDAKGKDQAASGAAREIDPCALLTTAEVSEFLGVLEESKRDARGATDMCFWDGESGRELSVALVTAPSSAGKTVNHGYGWNAAEFRGSDEASGLDPLAGIGDLAFSGAEHDNSLYGDYAEVVVLHHGGRVYVVTVEDSDTEKLSTSEMLTEAKRLAAIVLARH